MKGESSTVSVKFLVNPPPGMLTATQEKRPLSPGRTSNRVREEAFLLMLYRAVGKQKMELQMGKIISEEEEKEMFI